jgi:hypothetical protein
LLAAAVAGWRAARAPEPGPSDPQILRAFEIVVFGEEHAPGEKRLAKWLRPIVYRLDEEIALTAEERAAVDGHFARLAALTGLAVRRTDFPEAANFAVILTDRASFEWRIARHLAPARRHLRERLARSHCVGLYERDMRTNEIVAAVAIVPVDHARERGLLQACAVEETTQALGLPNDSSAIGATLFDDRGAARDLTALDVMLVRLLYRGEFRPGMSKAEAMAIAPAALAKLRAER